MAWGGGCGDGSCAVWGRGVCRLRVWWRDRCGGGAGILFYADNSVAEAVPPLSPSLCDKTRKKRNRHFSKITHFNRSCADEQQKISAVRFRSGG